ncbi:hypothetical protein OSTOST_14065, partial [Ostertagia ostertagi]
FGFIPYFDDSYDLSSSTVCLGVTHGHHSGLNHLFYHLIATFGVSDHQGGIAILFLALLLRIGYDNSFRHLAVEIGGPKRLYSLVTTCSAMILTPIGVLSLNIPDDEEFEHHLCEAL